MRTKNKPHSKYQEGFSRHDFLRAALLIPASAFITACTKVFGLDEASLTNTILFPPTRVEATPTQTDIPTETVTPNQTETPIPTVSSTPTCEDSDQETVQIPDVDDGNIRPAEKRDLSEIKFATIHHSEVSGTEDYCALVERAWAIEKHHSTKDSARYTEGEYTFRRILYHFLISKDGSILPVQDPKYVRLHASDSCSNNESHNLYGIAICLDGNFDVEIPKEAQFYSAAQIIRDWQQAHNVKLSIQGHNERIDQSNCGEPPKSCPGINMGFSSDEDSKLSHIIEMANA